MLEQSTAPADSRFDSQPEPVLAEIVTPPPPPWRFGLQGLMGVTAVCCLQFALMNWFGVIVGLLLAIGLCMAAFAGVFAVALTIGRSRAGWLDRLDQLGIRLVLALVVLILGTIFAGGGQVAFYQLAEITIARRMQADLGLSTKQVQVASDNGVLVGLQIDRVDLGSAADQAGLKAGEVIVLEGTAGEFFRQMQQNRSKEVALNLAVGATMQPLEKCSQRQVAIVVPSP